MPGYAAGVLETKLVSVFPGHEPSHQALIALFDDATGTPLAVMGGTHITAARTGAASALSTRLLAREDARVLAVLGTGVQARSHLDAVTRVREFDEVRVAGRSREPRGERSGRTSADTFEAAVRGADVVCACTDASAAGPATRVAHRGSPRDLGRTVQRRARARRGHGARGRARGRVARRVRALSGRRARAPGPRSGRRRRGSASWSRVPARAARRPTSSPSTSRWDTRPRTRPPPAWCTNGRSATASGPRLTL